MRGGSKGKYVCGVGLAQVATELHGHKGGNLVAHRGFDPPARASHPRTTHSGGIHGMVEPGWHHVLDHPDWCVCF